MQNVNYTEQLKARFAENSNKLFFVDGFKNRAFTAVKSMLFTEAPASSVCVVSNLDTALQVKSALYGNGNATVISSLAEFKKLYHSVALDTKLAAKYADKFKETYPNIIITLNTPTGEPVLHAELAHAEGKSGEYKMGDHALYALSDLLSDAEYSAVIVDNVYDMFAFREVESVENMDQREFDYINLMNKSFVTDIAHSYKKLARLVDSAQKAIVISNSVLDRNIVSFYAAASLVSSEFSYKKTKKLALTRTFNYDNDVDRVFESVSYSEADESVQTRCIQHTRGRGQTIPGTAERLGKYLVDNLKFMTKEEIFLRAFSILSKGRSGMNNDAIIDLLDDDNTLGDTVCDMFFGDSLKGDIESKIEYARLVDMKAEQTAIFFEVFKKYAIYCESGSIDNRCSIYRIYHDDSGFEDLIRRSSEAFDRNENALCASHFGDDASFKCIATKNLLDEATLKTPLLIVTKADPKQVASSMSKITDKNVYVLPADATSIEGGSVAVTNYKSFEALTNSLAISSAVFFDAISDLNLLDTLTKKALNMADNVNIALLTTYDNAEGLLVDIWQGSWIDENQNHLSIKNSEVYIRGERPFDYDDVFSKLDGVYKTLKNLIDGTEDVSYRSFASKFNETVTDLTLRRAAHTEETEEDFGYLAKISPYYAGIFANSVSVGTLGMEVFSERPYADAHGKKKRKKTEFEQVKETNRVAFNICSKQLHETCDYRNSDCFTCPLYRKNISNNIEIFADSVRGYFKESSKIMAKIQSDRIKRQLDDTIGGGGGSANDNSMDIERVKSVYKDVNKTLNVMLQSSPSVNAPFYGQYSHIFDIKEAVQSVHFDIFKKYYEQLTYIFEKATKEMKKSFDAVGQGAKSSLHTL